MKTTLALLFLGMLQMGCATGSLVETAPTVASLSAYDQVTINISYGDLADAVHAPLLMATVSQMLREKKIFRVVSEGPNAAPTPLVLNLTIVGSMAGNKFMHVAASGGAESQIGVDGVLIDTRTGGTVGAFSASGDSTRRTETHVLGFNTAWTDNLEKMMIDSVSKRIVSYLKQHR